MTTVTAEQQLKNLANLVKRQTTPTRRNVGRGDNFAASKQEIAESAAQLADYILAFLAGELKEIDGDSPF